MRSKLVGYKKTDATDFDRCAATQPGIGACMEIAVSCSMHDTKHMLNPIGMEVWV
jgi:hypothetical protein